MDIEVCLLRNNVLGVNDYFGRGAGFIGCL